MYFSHLLSVISKNKLFKYNYVLKDFSTLFRIVWDGTKITACAKRREKIFTIKF